MHVAVFADMEGSFGIWRKSQCRHGRPEWQYGRECLTADVNSVIRGAFNGGADKVTVKDTHDTGFNCIRSKIDKRAKYNGGPYLKPTIFGNITGFDLVLYVGIHAASGTAGAFFPHTHFGEFSELRLNGKPICEMELYGGFFGEMGIPVGFASGEDIAVNQAKEAMPWLRTVNVDKNKESCTAGEKSTAYLSNGRRLLYDQASEAVCMASSMKPLIYEAPLYFEAIFASDGKAARYNTWGLDRDGAVIRWESPTMTHAFDTINKLSWFPRKRYPYLPLVLFAFRRYFYIKNNLFPPRINSEGAELPKSNEGVR
jgi:D-amino peptidase